MEKFQFKNYNLTTWSNGDNSKRVCVSQNEPTWWHHVWCDSSTSVSLCTYPYFPLTPDAKYYISSCCSFLAPDDCCLIKTVRDAIGEDSKLNGVYILKAKEDSKLDPICIDGCVYMRDKPGPSLDQSLFVSAESPKSDPKVQEDPTSCREPGAWDGEDSLGDSVPVPLLSESFQPGRRRGSRRTSAKP